MASSSVPPACGWEIETGFFTEAELAVADQLVQLSGSCGGGDEASSPTSSSSSLRSVNTYTAAEAWEVDEEVALAGPSEELDRRAKKRYRLLSDLYAATKPSTGASATTSGAKKRKRRGEPDGKAAMPRYGDQSCY